MPFYRLGEVARVVGDFLTVLLDVGGNGGELESELARTWESERECLLRSPRSLGRLAAFWRFRGVDAEGCLIL